MQLGAGRIAWEAGCKHVGADRGASPTLAELEAGDAEILRRKLFEAADACAAQLGSALLGR